MKRRPSHLVCASLATLGVASSLAAQPEVVSISVDATAAGTPLTPIWAYYGYDEPNYTTAAEGKELLRILAAMHRVPVRTRTHFLFNTGDGTPALKWGSTNLYTEDANGNPIYDFTILDAILDAAMEAGTYPLFELGFMPQALSTRPEPYEPSNTYVLDSGSFYPPRDYERWAALVGEVAQHVKQRYPDAQPNWQWELWNEPDIGYWQGTFEEYAKLYDYTQAALHEVLPDASLGGPAVANPVTGFLAQFLEHCATGTNAVTGQRGTRLDMVSFHAKGGVTLADGHVQMDMSTQLRLHEIGFDIVAASQFAQAPIVISEADPDGCAACPVRTAPHHAYRNSPAYGAYEVSMMKRTLDLAADTGVNLRGVLTWAFTFPDSPYFAGYRALTTNGIHLPVLNAFKLLGSLDGNRLPVTSSGALPMQDVLTNGVRQAPDVDALAAINGNTIQVLVWNYHDDLVDAEASPIAVTVEVPPAYANGALVTHTRVDKQHGDAFTVWEAQGSPEAPSAMQLAELREAMEPVVIEPAHVAAVVNGAVSLSFDLPRFGISLLTLEPPRSTDAGAPDASSSEGQDGAYVEQGGCRCRTVAPRTTRTNWFQLLAAVGFFAATWVRRRRASGPPAS